MKDFSLEWPVLTRFGEHEAIMQRLALYMDWGKVEEPEQADLLLEHYKKDVGRLIRTLTAARTPSPEMAAAVMELAEKNSEPVSAALRVMFFVFRLMNMAQGIPLSGMEVDSPERMTKLLELAMGMIENTAYAGKLPCTECYEWHDSIVDLLTHMRSEHPHLNEGAEMMTQENEGNDGGEAQADASAGVTQSGAVPEQPATGEVDDGSVAVPPETEQPAETEEEATPDTEESGGAEGSPPETTDAPPAVGEIPPDREAPPEQADEPEIDADAGEPNGPSESGPDEQSEADRATEEGRAIASKSSGEPDAASEPGEDLVQPDAEQSRVDEMARKNCISIIAEMNDVTAHNHMKPQSWWANNLFTLHQFIIGA